jgi:2,4-dienoyl-CoA reductase-like NADH-dependent reductase (Old Yellow Enzyme family)
MAHFSAKRQGWKAIVDAVHAEGSLISLQLWHMGRQGHSSLAGVPTVSASPLKLDGEVRISPTEKVAYETPHALTTDEIAGVVGDYRKAAVNGIKAGFG